MVHPYRHPGRYVAYSFQDPNLQPFSTRVDGIPGSSTRNLLDSFGLADKADKHPLDLPWVLRKRLSIATTLGRATPVVILDEPTLGQDDTFCNHLSRVLHEQSQSGRIVIVISHSPHFAELLGNNVVEITRLKAQPYSEGNRGIKYLLKPNNSRLAKWVLRAKPSLLTAENFKYGESIINDGAEKSLRAWAS